MKILRCKISSVNLCLEALALSHSVEVNTQVCLRSDALALGVNFRGGVWAHGGQFDFGDFLTSPLDPGGDFWTTTQPLEPIDLIQVEGRRYPMEVHLVHKVISLSSQGLMMHTYAIGCIGWRFLPEHKVRHTRSSPEQGGWSRCPGLLLWGELSSARNLSNLSVVLRSFNTNRCDKRSFSWFNIL